MTRAMFEDFQNCCTAFRGRCEELTRVQQRVPVVYNTSLDNVNEANDIRLILVADNPGTTERDEGRYLIGDVGQIARCIFRDRLGMELDRDVIVLNKTPLHTANTQELANLMADDDLRDILMRSQGYMADLIKSFRQALGGIPVWIVGKSHLKQGDIFEVFIGRIKEFFDAGDFGEQLYVFRHFSHCWFENDLDERALTGEAPLHTLNRIGAEYRNEVLTALER